MPVWMSMLISPLLTTSFQWPNRCLNRSFGAVATMGSSGVSTPTMRHTCGLIFFVSPPPLEWRPLPLGGVLVVVWTIIS